MKKVLFFDQKPVDDFFGYRIETFDFLAYFIKNNKWSITDFIANGLNGYYKTRALQFVAAGVDKLYREQDPFYMKMVKEFIDRFQDFDLIVMGNYNFIHPEIFNKYLKKPIKILGFIDDPMSTYYRGIPYLWAFDGAFYISPSYNQELLFSEALSLWAPEKPIKWWPLVEYPVRFPNLTDSFFTERNIDITYVGNPTGTKFDRLIKLKNHFGKRIRIHGRWRFKGYFGYLRGLTGKPFYPYRIISIDPKDKINLYWNTKIGFNMHVSDNYHETGNQRMYDVPAHGMLLVCDKAGKNAHNQIFKGGEEAIYYDSIEHAIELMEFYLKNDEERIHIARKGFERYWQSYEWESNLKGLLDWAINLKRFNA